MMFTGYEPVDLCVTSRVDELGVSLNFKPLAPKLLDRFLALAAITRYVCHSPVLHEAVVWIVANYDLAVQESRIVASLANGSTRAVLNRDLGISPNTLKGHLRTLLRKVAVHDTDELISIILRAIGGWRGQRSQQHESS